MQIVAVDPEPANVGRTCPRLVPRHNDMVTDLVTSDRIASSVGTKSVKKLVTFRVGEHEIGGHLSLVWDEDPRAEQFRVAVGSHGTKSIARVRHR